MPAAEGSAIVRDDGVGRAVAGSAVALALGLSAPAGAQSTSLFSQSVVGNVDRLIVTPDLSTVYDSNVLRASNARIAGPKDNFRVTPGVAVSVNRLFGRTRITVSGRGGYDFNSRFSGLDRTRINAAGSAQLPVGAICSVRGGGSYDLAQFDLEDVDVDAVGSRATSKIQRYDATVRCDRPVGFSPVVGFAYQDLTNSRRPVFNYDHTNYRAGIAYDRPSLGTVTFLYERSMLRRPNVFEVTGVKDGSDIDQYLVSLRRSVAPRVRITLSAGYLKVKPQRPGVAPFSGLSFDGQVRLLPTPRFIVSLSAARDVQTQSGFNATYTIRTSYNAGIRWQASAKSIVDAGVTRSLRDFNGEGLVSTAPARGADRIDSVSAGYSYDMLRAMRFRVGIARRIRRSDNAFYDYGSTIATATVGARF